MKVQPDITNLMTSMLSHPLSTDSVDCDLKEFSNSTVNPLLSPPGAYFFQALLREGGLKREGGLFNLAKHITCSKNTVVSDRVDLRVVQFKSLSKVFDSLVIA